MAWSTVQWYSLGYSVQDREFFFYYGLDGDSSAYQIFVSAAEAAALGDMFRNEGPVSFNSDGNYFVTDQERVGEAESSGRTRIVAAQPS